MPVQGRILKYKDTYFAWFYQHGVAYFAIQLYRESAGLV